MSERSVGHIAFAEFWEFYAAGELGDVYRAPRRNPVMVTSGQRIGRWESTASWWARYGASTLNALGVQA